MYVHVYSSVIAQGISCISPMYIYALSVCVGGGGGGGYVSIPTCTYVWSSVLVFVCVCKFLHLKFISVCVILCVMISVLDFVSEIFLHFSRLCELFCM